MDIIKISSSDDYINNNNLKFSKKYYFNKEKDFIINFLFQDFTFKILIKLTKKCPSKIKIVSKYVRH